jgi:hypothetical protein
VGVESGNIASLENVDDSCKLRASDLERPGMVTNPEVSADLKRTAYNDIAGIAQVDDNQGIKHLQRSSDYDIADQTKQIRPREAETSGSFATGILNSIKDKLSPEKKEDISELPIQEKKFISQGTPLNAEPEGDLISGVRETMDKSETSVAPAMSSVLKQYDSIVQQLMDMIEKSAEGQRIVHDITGVVNGVQDFLAQNVPPSRPEDVNNWLCALDKNLLDMRILPTDSTLRIFGLMGLSETIELAKTSEPLKLIVCQAATLLRAIGENRITEEQTKSLIRTFGNMALTIQQPLASIVLQTSNTLKQLDQTGSVREGVEQIKQTLGDVNNLQQFIDMITDWVLYIAVHVLPVMKIDDVELDIPAMVLRVENIHLSKFNVQRDKIHITPDLKSGELRIDIAGLGFEVVDLQWSFHQKQLSMEVAAGRLDCKCSNAEWHAGLGLRSRSDNPDIPKLKVISKPVIKLEGFDVTMKDSLLSKVTNMTMAIFHDLIGKALEKGLSLVMRLVMKDALKKLNDQIADIAPAVLKLVSLGQLVLASGVSDTSSLEDSDTEADVSTGTGSNLQQQVLESLSVPPDETGPDILP